MVIVCHSQRDAEYIKEALEKRLAEFKLTLNRDKTKLVEFSKRKARRGEQQEGFYFLGFIWYWGRSRKGLVIPKLKTDGKRFRSKLKKVNVWARKICKTVELKEVWKCCCSRLRGHIQYYGVSHNMKRVAQFHFQVKRILFEQLNRRSQKRSMNWELFTLYEQLNPLPKPRIYLSLF